MSDCRRDLRARALWVVLGCLVCQLGLGFGYVFGPLAPDILAEFGWSRAEFSFARTPQLFATALTSPLVGFLVVRFGARGVLVSACLVLGLSFALLSGMQSLWHYYALITLMGLSVTGLGDITVGAAVSEWFTKRRGLALGIVYSGSNLAGFVLTRLADSMAVATSWRSALLTIGVGGTLVILPFALFAVRSPRASERPRDEDGGGAHVVTDRDMPLRDVVRTRSFWVLLAGTFTFFFYFLGMLEHFVLFLRDEGMPREQAVAYFSFAIGLGIVSKLGCGLLADRLHARSTLLLDFGLLALSSLVLLALPDPRLIWVYVLSYAFATAARDVVYPLIIQHCFGVRHMAEIYGVLMLALLPGGGLGPLFAGVVHDRTGSYDLAFATFAVLNAAAVLALTLVRDERAASGSARSLP